MQDLEKIEHTGIVQSIEDNHVNVSIISSSACAGCHAAGVCEVSSTDEKIIRTLKTIEVKRGEMVMVMMEKSMGFKALFLGYLLPFMLVLTILVTFTALSFSEPVAGSIALISLLPYYLFIYLRKEKIGKKFSFTIKKLNQ
jgi:sigma-E factor negative regulatory protein RseC